MCTNIFKIVLQLLAFEAITSLRMRYHTYVTLSKDCSRMCKKKFKPYSMKENPLSKINETLAESKIKLINKFMFSNDIIFL